MPFSSNFLAIIIGVSPFCTRHNKGISYAHTVLNKLTKLEIFGFAFIDSNLLTSLRLLFLHAVISVVSPRYNVERRQLSVTE